MTIARDIPSQGDPARQTVDLYVEQTEQALHVCDLIEALADDLPKRVAVHWRDVQFQCRSVLRPYFGFLNDVVFPKMLSSLGNDMGRLELLQRLQRDCSDQLHALSDLDDLISDALLLDKFDEEPEALGFALRGHFDALRRDLNWQMDVLWPLARRAWTTREARTIMQAAPFANAVSPGGPA